MNSSHAPTIDLGTEASAISRVLEWARRFNPLARVTDRLLLSRAKHRSLAGHPRIALRLSRWIPPVVYGPDRFFSVDGAPAEVSLRRQAGFDRLGRHFREQHPKTLAAAQEVEGSISDLDFVNAHRVPFQFRKRVQEALPVPTFAEETRGAQVRDLDGHWAFDLGGAYGVNLFGFELYKRCMERGLERSKDLGLVLGPYHPIVGDNVRRLKAVSGLDQVSFHMSGTEAVMQAVRLARYHSKRSHVVRFCGAYHGWWDGVQAGPGNPRPVRDLYTLEELNDRSLRVLETRRDIACVLVNPIQAMHPNRLPASDSTLLASNRSSSFDKESYRAWLGKLRDVCTRRKIALILDEVFLGFRLAPSGVQEYFGVQADIVAYGKTLGGGLPVGVLCGREAWMKRFSNDRPGDVCFARGTFNSHPLVMATMNEFLLALDSPELRSTYEGLEDRWNARAALLNRMLEESGAPVRVANMVSVFTTLFIQPARYNWMLQYYLRTAGLLLSWIGTGRYIFSHDLSDGDFAEICRRFVSGVSAMQADGWWWHDPGMTNSTIQKSVLKELLSARLGKGARQGRPR